MYNMFSVDLKKRIAWRRLTLTGGNPQLPSALKSLTSVFGMGTGVTSSPSSPDYVSSFLRTFIIITLVIINASIIFNKF